MRISDVGTSFGRVRLWDRAEAEGLPLVVCISGAFSPLDYLWWLDDPAHHYVFAHLPGFYSEVLAETSIDAFAQAIGDAVERLWPGEPYVGLGVSTGALVALSLPACSVVAVEPFFRTAPLWAFHEFLARQSAMHGWSEAIFADRDYRHILADLAVPCEAVVGSLPLEPRRPLTKLPSLTSAADRAALLAHPLVSLTVANGGHDLPCEAISAALRRGERAIAGEGVDRIAAR